MTTPQKTALINAQQVYTKIKNVRPEITNYFFNMGVEFGRKRALEEAIAICNEAGHSEDQYEIAEKIKELLT